MSGRKGINFAELGILKLRLLYGGEQMYAYINEQMLKYPNLSEDYHVMSYFMSRDESFWERVRIAEEKRKPIWLRSK